METSAQSARRDMALASLGLGTSSVVPRSQLTPKLIVRESPIAGFGLYAVDRIELGEVCCRLAGRRMSDEEFGRYIAGRDHYNAFTIDEGVNVLQAEDDPTTKGNHSCDPNTYVKTIASKRLVLALRDIATGEEITYDYCINGSGDTVWTCACGASRCRHMIHSDFFHLPVELQCAYLRLLDDWFRQERTAEISGLQTVLSGKSTAP